MKNKLFRALLNHRRLNIYNFHGTWIQDDWQCLGFYNAAFKVSIVKVVKHGNKMFDMMIDKGNGSEFCLFVQYLLDVQGWQMVPGNYFDGMRPYKFLCLSSILILILVQGAKFSLSEPEYVYLKPQMDPGLSLSRHKKISSEETVNKSC